MIGLLGQKVGMTQIFNEDGRQVPVTVLQVGPCRVTDIRTKERDGYSAIQLGFDEVAERKVNAPKLGQFKKRGIPALRFLREIRTDDVQGIQVGQELKSDNFEVGDVVDVEGVSIGKGFQGVVRRHHFKGPGSHTHGQKAGNKPGSIGASAYPSRVMKGMRGPGRMGNRRVTVQNLKIVTVDHENDLIAVRGAVPGFEGRYLVVRAALKKNAGKKWNLPEKPKATKEEAPQEAKPEASEQKS